MDVVALLRAAHRAMSIEEIEARLHRGVSRLEMAACGDGVKEVAKDVWEYERAWLHVVDKESMCLLLQSTTRGIAKADLSLCYPSAVFDTDALIAEGFVTVIEDKLFYSHPEYRLPLSDEMLAKWHLAQLKEPQPVAPSKFVVKRKKQQKRTKLDRHNQHVSDLW